MERFYKWLWQCALGTWAVTALIFGLYLFTDISIPNALMIFGTLIGTAAFGFTIMLFVTGPQRRLRDIPVLLVRRPLVTYLGILTNVLLALFLAPDLALQHIIVSPWTVLALLHVGMALHLFRERFPENHRMTGSHVVMIALFIMGLFDLQLFFEQLASVVDFFA